MAKLRVSIGGVYAWRARHRVTSDGVTPLDGQSTERDRMLAEAEFAFRQAFALCPRSPEALFSYANLLHETGRSQDAILIAEAAPSVDPQNRQIENLLGELHRSNTATSGRE